MRVASFAFVALAVTSCQKDRAQALSRSPAPSDRIRPGSSRALSSRVLPLRQRQHRTVPRSARFHTWRPTVGRASSRHCAEPNRAGDEWSWVPSGSDGFNVHWAGIDGTMDFAVRRHGSGWSAEGGNSLGEHGPNRQDSDTSGQIPVSVAGCLTQRCSGHEVKRLYDTTWRQWLLGRIASDQPPTDKHVARVMRARHEGLPSRLYNNA
jgi:hypothetical protein